MRLRPLPLVVALLLTITAAAEFVMGRQGFGPDGRFGWWEGNIWSQEQSQRLADPYSFTHIEHGLLFYVVLWLAARRADPRVRLAAAVAIEAGWEILENSPIVIDRYRAVTIALGYVGDSVLNSVSDVAMMAFGFAIAARAPVRVSVALAVIMELGLLFWVRDNLALNILMLVHPVDAIRVWQMAGQP